MQAPQCSATVSALVIDGHECFLSLFLAMAVCDSEKGINSMKHS
jgi:hypothetical protein